MWFLTHHRDSPRFCEIARLTVGCVVIDICAITYDSERFRTLPRLSVSFHTLLHVLTRLQSLQLDMSLFRFFFPFPNVCERLKHGSARIRAFSQAPTRFHGFAPASTTFHFLKRNSTAFDSCPRSRGVSTVHHKLFRASKGVHALPCD